MTHHDDDADTVLDEICTRFEEALKGGETPRIEQALTSLSPSLRTAVLVELVQIELWWKRKWKRDITLAAYLERFPTDDAAVRSAFDSFAQQSAAADQAPVEALDNAGMPTVHASLSPAPADTVLTSEAGRHSGAETLRSDSRFQILRPHAKGGLGEVFVAQDDQLNRAVALKEIQARHADAAESRHRFVLEAEITGGLEHPGVVPVYALGHYEDGRPYYAMRFIRGESLLEAVTKFHERTNHEESDSRLQLRRLLARFNDVCQTISYAHSRGVLHRDLKPANIMLGQYGETLVVDWGLAKVTGQQDGTDAGYLQLRSDLSSHQTVVGAAMGTPAYMSPEQAAGRIEELGAASDVYSLGATLYHILTGSPPLDSESLADLLEKVRKGEFPVPREREPTVPAALQAVCLKAMSLRPSDRYPTPQDLADEIDRFVADEPVRAFADPWIGRARRWMRRHQTLATTTAAVLLLSVAGLAAFSSVLGSKNARLLSLNNTLDRRNDELVAARDLAQTNERVARDQSELALSTLVSVVEDVQDGLRNVTGSSGVRRRLLATSLEKLESLASDYINEAAVDTETVRALHSMGDLILNFKEVSDGTDSGGETSTDDQVSPMQLANSLFERAHQIAVALHDREQPPPDSERLLAESHNRLGKVLYRQGRFASAIGEFEEELRLAQDLARQTASDRNEMAVAEAWGWLGDTMAGHGDAARALECYQTMVAVNEKRVSSKGHSTSADFGLSIAYNKLGEHLLQNDRLAEAFVVLEKGLAIRRRLAETTHTDPEFQRDLATSIAAVGDASLREGRIEDAISYYAESHAHFAQASALDPADLGAARDVIISCESLGAAESQRENFAEATRWFREAVQRYQRLVSHDPENMRWQRGLSICLNKLGTALARSELHGDAETEFRRALEIRRKLVAVDSSSAGAKRDLMISLANIGDILSERKEYDAAMDYYLEAHDTLGQIAQQHPTDLQAQRDLVVSGIKLTNNFLGREDYENAIEIAREARDTARTLAESEPTNARSQHTFMASEYTLGGALEANSRYDEAIVAFQAAADVLRSMIDNGLNVESSRRELRILTRAIERAGLSEVAFGNWDAIMRESPARRAAILDVRATRYVHAGRIEEAAVAANAIGELDEADAGTLYNAACVLSLCAASVDKSDGTNLEQRRTWIDRALALLRKSVAGGWNDFDHMRSDSDLQVLHAEAAFRELVAPQESP